MQFDLRSTSAPPDLRLDMDGELDIFTAGQVSRAVSQALAEGCRHARLDLTGVTFVDASALGVFVRTKELLRTWSGTLEIVAFSPVVLRLCALTGLLSLLPAEAPQKV